MLLVDSECVIIRKDDPPASWDALIASARHRPGKQIWVGPATGGLDHVVAQQIWERLGIDCVWSAYESGKNAVDALRRGEGDAYVGNPSEVTGFPSLQVAAISSPVRLHHLPDTPTFAESGIQNLDEEFMWRGFAVQKGCPPDALQFYDQLFRRVTEDPEWREHWEKFGIEVLYHPSSRFEEEVAKDRATFAKYHIHKPPTSSSAWWIALTLSLAALVTAMRFVKRSESKGLKQAVIPIVIICVCILLVVQTHRFPYGKGIGPAAMPQMLSVIICWLSVITIAQNRRTAPAAAATTQRTDLVGWLVLTLVGYVVATMLFGYVFSTLVFLIFQMRTLGERRLPIVISVSLGWLAFAYIVFEQLLKMPLPEGLLWIHLS